MQGNSSSCSNVVDCSHDALPDACGNEERQERLLERQEQSLVERERNLLIACGILVVLMNVSTGRYVLYPFKIFSTWVHEMCHGLAAILSGGYIAKLEIFKTGAGLAYTASPHPAFVSSAGYPGTAVTGCLLLLFRRTTLGPTIGTIGLGAAQLLSCALYVRNTWGLIFLSIQGILLLFCGWKLPAAWLEKLYTFLALTVSLNAIENIQDLYGSSQGYAGGELRGTDAHSVSTYWGGDYRMWATIWLVMSLVLTAVGIVGARNARALPWSANNTITTSSTIINSNNNTNSPVPVVTYGNSTSGPTTTTTNSGKSSVWSRMTPSWRSPDPAPIPGYVAHVV